MKNKEFTYTSVKRGDDKYMFKVEVLKDIVCIKYQNKLLQKNYKKKSIVEF